jgi:selenocysteine lyase/cysteine desulfurase
MLGDRLIEELSVLGFKYIGSDNKKERSGIYSFTCENEKALFEYLQKNRIHISLRNGVIRFSPHFYNTLEEIDRVVEVLNRRGFKPQITHPLIPTCQGFFKVN